MSYVTRINRAQFGTVIFQTYPFDSYSITNRVGKKISKILHSNPNLKFHPLSNEPPLSTSAPHRTYVTLHAATEREGGSVSVSYLPPTFVPLPISPFLLLLHGFSSLHEMLQLNHASRQPGKGGRAGSS